DRSRDRQQCRRIAILDKVMLGQPHVIEAVLLAPHDLFEDFVVEPVGRLLPLRRIAEIVPQSEAQLISICGTHRVLLSDYSTDYSYSCARIQSAARSPIIMQVRLVLARTIFGITEASTTRNPSMPRTREYWSTTASLSESGPIFAVVVGWKIVVQLFRTNSAAALSDSTTSRLIL